MMPLVILVAESEGALTGFVEVGLRSIADGCEPSKPVGFLEGWYVADSARRQGVGAELVRAAEEWSRGYGCAEMASDVLLENDLGQRAHEGVGYEVVCRAVHYRKPL